MKRVLIVDDTSFMRISLRKILESNGFEVVGEAVKEQAGGVGDIIKGVKSSSWRSRTINKAYHRYKSCSEFKY